MTLAVAALVESAIVELELEHPATVLDIGCGAGRPGRVISERWPRALVIGFDLLPEHAASAAGGVRPLAASFEQLPIADRRIHAAIAIETLCHAPDLDSSPVFSELQRVLRPGGVAAFAEPLARCGRRRPSGLERWICRRLALGPLLGVDRFRTRLAEAGLTEISRREVTWRLAPSALLLQIALLRRLGGALRLRRLPPSELWLRVSHLGAVLAAAAVGLTRRHGYYLIAARKTTRANFGSGIRPDVDCGLERAGSGSASRLPGTHRRPPP